jgi:TonB family protein
LVKADGQTGDVKIVRTPNPALAAAATRAVRTWRFTPAHNFRGEAVPVVVDVAVSFRLGILPPPAAVTASAAPASK